MMDLCVIKCQLSKLCIIINKIYAICLLIDRSPRSITSNLINLTPCRFTILITTSWWLSIFLFFGMFDLHNLIILNFPSTIGPHYNLSQTPSLPIIITIIIWAIILNHLLLLLIIHIITLIINIILIFIIEKVVTFRLLWIRTLLVFESSLRTMLGPLVIYLWRLV